jgi:hypothetical protein
MRVDEGLEYFKECLVSIPLAQEKCQIRVDASVSFRWTNAGQQSIGVRSKSNRRNSAAMSRLFEELGRRADTARAQAAFLLHHSMRIAP